MDNMLHINFSHYLLFTLYSCTLLLAVLLFVIITILNDQLNSKGKTRHLTNVNFIVSSAKGGISQVICTPWIS